MSDMVEYDFGDLATARHGDAMVSWPRVQRHTATMAFIRGARESGIEIAKVWSVCVERGDRAPTADASLTHYLYARSAPFELDGRIAVENDVALLQQGMKP